MKYNATTVAHRAKITAKLQACTTMQQMLDVLSKEYKLNECKPGIATKPALIKSLVNTVLPMLNPELNA